MKCPKCGHDQKVKYGLTCGGCGYEFVFNPKDSATRGLTDGKFEACIRAASQNGTAYFTRNQLYAAFCNRMSDSGKGDIGFGLILLAVAGALCFVITTLWLIPIIIGLIGFSLVMAGIQAARRKFTPQYFAELLERRRSGGRTIDRLIEEPSLHEPPPDWSEPDIYDYGVERILIVERDILVDLLVKNGVHAEQRMLVLSETGYPEYLLPVARRLLQERPDLPVFLLHDATPHGTDMKERVLASGLLPLDGHPLIDLGMFPADFQQLNRTKRFDPDNELRELPVDVLMLPFLTAGMAAAMAQGVPLGTMIQQQHERTSDVVGSDFG